ncbi:MAG: c-type cytochrome [Alphaproteobacteria bacterium]|nr:c-type cytochrome [Alphaproteobacteria bacterium]
MGVSRIRRILFGLLVLTPAVAHAYDPVEAGGKKAVQCAPCHGLNGISRYPSMPNLAGQKRDVLMAQIGAFLEKPSRPSRSGAASRSEGVMEHSVEGLSEKGALDLAFFFSSLPCALPVRQIPSTVPEVVIRCSRCHGANGRNTYKNVPDLAGQKKHYLENQIRALRESGLVANDPLLIRKRSHPMMGPQALFLTESEIKSLAAHFASQTCR